MKKIILLGAPGAGKGTQAARIIQKYDIPHISTGDIFRKNIKEGTALGKKAKEYIDKGELVPDSVVIDIVRDRLAQSDCAKGWLLDGFPRTVAQAEALDTFAKADAVVNLDVDLNQLAARLTGRRVCEGCGESYHASTYKFLTCAKCARNLITREDDKPATVAERLGVYERQTAPLIDFYSAKGILKTVNGLQSIDEVTADVFKALC